MKNKYETAVIFKKKQDANNNIEFVPINIIKGMYDDNKKTFISTDGTNYYHIIRKSRKLWIWI